MSIDPKIASILESVIKGDVGPLEKAIAEANDRVDQAKADIQALHAIRRLATGAAAGRPANGKAAVIPAGRPPAVNGDSDRTPLTPYQHRIIEFLATQDEPLGAQAIAKGADVPVASTYATCGSSNLFEKIKSGGSVVYRLSESGLALAAAFGPKTEKLDDG